MAKSTLKDRVCQYCAGPIWYNTFLMEWFHAHDEQECPVVTGPSPAPIKRTRSPKESTSVMYCEACGGAVHSLDEMHDHVCSPKE